jgi:hypothetical protein
VCVMSSAFAGRSYTSCVESQRQGMRIYSRPFQFVRLDRWKSLYIKKVVFVLSEQNRVT